MKHLPKQTFPRAIIASVVLACIIVPTVAFARDGDSTTNNTSDDSSSTVSDDKVTVSTAVTDKKSHAEAELRDKVEAKTAELRQKSEEQETELRQKLDDKKKQICEKQQSSINTVMDNMDKRRQNAFEHISKVSDAVQAFYVKKQLHVDNYNDLIAAIATAKAAADSAMKGQLSVPQLDCTSDHPRVDVQTFKDKRKASINANGAYRDAVKNLITAVKAALKTDKGDAS